MTDPTDQAVHEIADHIADLLGEKDLRPRHNIYRIVKVCGVAFAERMMNKTREVEDSGGLLTMDGTRRRTIGGVFFNVTYNYINMKRFRTHAWRQRAVELSDVFPDFAPQPRIRRSSAQRPNRPFNQLTTQPQQP